MNGTVQKIKDSKPFGKLDLIITAVLVTVTLIVSVITLCMPGGNTVEITAGEFNAEYPLDVDRQIKLNGLTVVIEGGYVYVTDAACLDKRCESMGKISKAGQTIVCSPQAVVVKIRSEESLDGVVG